MLIFGLFIYQCLSMVHGWSLPFNLGEKILSFFGFGEPAIPTTTVDYPSIEYTDEALVCRFTLNENIPITPLILTADELPAIVYPDDNNEIILNAGERLRITCLDKTLNRSFSQQRLHDIIVTCVKDDTLSYDDDLFTLAEIECEDFPSSVTKRRDTMCFKNHTLVDVGFICDDTFLKTYTVCFDEYSENALYTWYESSMLHAGRQIRVPRPHFSDKEFYTFKVDSAYNFYNQKNWLAYLLGSYELAERFMVNDRQHYLSRGHLTPKADLLYGFEQAATFHFINAAPQWQTFNAGNWERLEVAVRDLLVKEKKRYRVITGTYGIATLPDVNDKEKELHLYADENNNPLLRVPKFFWKIIYDFNKDSGVVIIGVNNPYLKTIPPDYIICHNICSRIKWLPQFRNDISKGYIYCCDMDEFLEVTGFDTTFLQ